MAVGNLPAIAAYLLDRGRPGATPEAGLQVENPRWSSSGPTVPLLPAGDGNSP